jgi:uncharacterized membrane protein YhaH (DUF805 family)
MVKNIKQHLAVISVLLLAVLTLTVTDAIAQSTNITVSTSRNPVALDDSFHLIYEADSSVDDDPDFTPVYKNFDVLSSAQSTNMRSINGNWSMKKTWDLTVMAKDVGKFTIPPVSFGSDVSPAIQVTVKNSSSPNSVSPDGKATIPAKIFLESEVDRKTGWVQSQFIYTVRLLRTVNITSASLTDPVTSDADAIIQSIGEDQYQTTRNGIRYEVIERRYAIFPQKSGQLTIKPITFEGRVNTTQPRSIFDQFRMSGQLKRLRSRAVEATVKPAPASINLQDWLPAKEVQLIEEWSDDIQNIKTGEPVTRTITIAADGLTSAQLPNLDFTEVDGLQQYPDKPVSEDRQGADGITGIKQYKVALIPGHAGSFTLPEIKLSWWNTATNKAETASIPSTEITAIGNAAASPVNNVTTESPGLAATPAIQGQVPASADRAITPAMDEPYWKWLAMLFAIAWLLTLLLLLKKTRIDVRPVKDTRKSMAASLKECVNAVGRHAKKNEPEATRDALIEWAKIFYSDNTISNLSLITTNCSPQLSEAIENLNQSLYSPVRPAWNGKSLLLAFNKEQSFAASQKHKHASTLKPLYNT